MKKLTMLACLMALMTGCSYEWQVRPTPVFRPAPMFCYVAFGQPHCSTTAEQCVSEERLHDDVSTVPCRAIYMAR